ncbi:MAG: ATP-binding cassette domain-containing protein [Acidimicrobiales bacterium]
MRPNLPATSLELPGLAWLPNAERADTCTAGLPPGVAVDDLATSYGAVVALDGIGFTGQLAAVDANLTGRENLVLIGQLSRLGRERARHHAVDVLEHVGLSGAANRLAGTYSGGTRRRLDVAAALVHRPPVIFVDEPTTGLDPESRLWLRETVCELVAACDVMSSAAWSAGLLVGVACALGANASSSFTGTALDIAGGNVKV